MGEVSAAMFKLENSCKGKAKKNGCVFSVVLYDPLAGGMAFLKLL